MITLDISKFNENSINFDPKYDVEIMIPKLSEINIGEELILKNKPTNDFFLCNICLNIIINPKMCYECEDFFCSSCIDNYLSKKKECPTCRKTFEPMKIYRHIKKIC